MKNNLHGPLTPEFLTAAVAQHPDMVTLVSDDQHRLEYSFGIDVLKFKPQIREFVTALAAHGIDCGVETDFRHENILHAGDCGAKFVEIDVSDYKANSDHYALALDIAAERGILVNIKGPNVDEFASEMGESLINIKYNN